MSGQDKALDGVEYLDEAEPPEAEPLPESLRTVLDQFCESVGRGLGGASRLTLRARCERLLNWARHRHTPHRGTLEAFARAILPRAHAAFRREVSVERLQRELQDEHRRAAAAQSEDKLRKYLTRWERSVARFQVAFPSRWRVPGMTAEELRAELALRLLERMRRNMPWDPYERPGMEATFVFLDRERVAMRRRNRMYDATVPLGSLPASHADAMPTADIVAEHWDTIDGIRASIEATKHDLTPRQASWLTDFLEDVRIHDRLNEARVAHQRGRDRSAACHAKRVIGVVLLGKLDPALVQEQRLAEEDDDEKRARRLERATRRRPRSEKALPRRPIVLVGSDGPSSSEPRPVLRTEPQPPWFDDGDLVRIAETGECGVVLGSDHVMVGVLYRVKIPGDGRVVELPREALIRDSWVPF